jgi:molybdopterin-guanine dinucleotide biosynthesis protein A
MSSLASAFAPTPTSARALPPVSALVLAGYDPAHASGGGGASTSLGGHKALLEVAGRPMVAHVVEALERSPRVADITVAGIERSSLDLGSHLHYLPNRPTLLQNGLDGLRALLQRRPRTTHVLVTGSDTPLLTDAAVTWFIDGCGRRSADLYVALAERWRVEALFPSSRRTYMPTRVGPLCSADLFLVRPDVMLRHEALLQRLLSRRKSSLGLVRAVGWGWLLRLVLGRLHPDDLRLAAMRLAGVQMRPVLLPFAGAAMDVDKPFQMEMVRAFLEQRGFEQRNLEQKETGAVHEGTFGQP